MSFVVTAAERASFGRCPRQWDFAARARQNLESVRPPAILDLDRALRDALAVYYYPGMWDWDRGVRLPLAVQGLERAVARQLERCGDRADAGRWREQLDAARDLLTRYMRWAPSVDQFAPVLIEADYEVNVLDPAAPSDGLVTATGAAITYSGRIDLLAVDRHDAYWLVRHRVIDADWLPAEQLAQDEESLTACWAWQQFYLGMAITGTIYNELRRTPDTQARAAGDSPRPGAGRWGRLRSRSTGGQPAVRQHEPSGGGRSIPQHRRMYARAAEPSRVEPVEQRLGDGFRRTWLRRSPADIASAGRRLGADVAEMTRPGLNVYPNPSEANCPACPYLDPCQALLAGRPAAPVLLSGYRQRPADGPEEGRIGGGAWSTGRGAAPPKFRGSQNA